MKESIFISYQPMAKYVGNLVTELKKNDFIPVLPTEIIKIDSREVNINAFEQLKRRNPRNPFLMKMKKIILENEIAKLKESNALLIFNPLGMRSGYISSQQLIALTVAWQNNIPSYLLESPDPSFEHYEEVMAMNPIILKGNIITIKKSKSVTTVNQLKEKWLNNNTAINIEVNSIRPKLKLRIEE